MRKESSKNLENEILINNSCGMAYTLNVIGGRWKPAILYRLLTGAMRYSELRNVLPLITERVLVLQLRELEKDGLIEREVFPQVPPKVEYRLSALGQSLEPLLHALSDWGNANRPESDSLGVQPSAC